MDGPQSMSFGSSRAHGESSNPSSMDGPQSEPLVSLLQLLASLASNGGHHSFLQRLESLVSNDTHDSSNSENNDGYDPQYAELYQAVRTGNLEATKAILAGDGEAVRARISTEGKLPLHVAALFGHLEIVRELLQRMSAADVALQDDNKLTALHEAIYGEIEIAGCIIEKNGGLLTIPDNHGLLPVTRAFGFGQIKMVRYLYLLTPREVLQGTHGATLLNLCCYSKMFDIALDLLDEYPILAVTARHGGKTFLEAMASTPSAFPSGCQHSFWQRWIYNWIDIPNEQLRTSFREAQHETIQPNSPNGDIRVNMPGNTTSQSEETMAFFGIKNIYQIKLAHMQARELLRIACQELLALDKEQLTASGARKAVVEATKRGIPEFFTEVLKVRLDLFWTGNGRCLLFDAVEYRQARVFSLIHGVSWKNAVAHLVDYDSGNTLLHTAGLFGPSTELQLHGVSGAALQMQRELQWFKEVEKITPSDAKEAQNRKGLTARQFFTNNHKELVKQGEKWMKGTATSCSVVAALIATIVFAAAFTVPGGNNQNTGYPIFSEKMGFMVFILSDALSLFSSTTSILMFLGILTSRYAEDDFSKSLPTKLIIGLLTLFISMASMLIAFCAALFVMLRGQLWIVIPVSFLAAVPVFSFGGLQYPLLYEMIMSTYGPSIFDSDVEPWATADLI